tara:strand:+ start:437 stop:904 length:468 start_codon:yes stop_codon:yes gene_type:complete
MAITKIIADSITSGAIANTPNFLAYRSSSAQSVANNTTTTILFNAEKFDSNSAYNASNGIFTVPSDGVYCFGLNLYAGDDAPARYVGKLVKNSATLIYADLDVSNEPATLFVSTITTCSANDTIHATFYHNRGSAMNIDPSSTAEINYFFGYKLL